MSNFTFSGNNGKLNIGGANALKMNASPLLSVVNTMELSFVVSGGKFLLSLNGVTSQVKSWLDLGYKIQIQAVHYGGGVKRRHRMNFWDEENPNDATPGQPLYDYSSKGRTFRATINSTVTYPNYFRLTTGTNMFGATSNKTVKGRTPINRYKGSGFKSMDLTDFAVDIIRTVHRKAQLTYNSFSNVADNDGTFLSINGHSFKHIGFAVLINNTKVCETGIIRVQFNSDTSNFASPDSTGFTLEEGAQTNNLEDLEEDYTSSQMINSSYQSLAVKSRILVTVSN